MKKIGLEKENIVRIVADSLLLIPSFIGLFVIVLEGFSKWVLIILGIYILLFLLAIINEVYECIFYDDTHLVIQSFTGVESINFADIEKIKREFIRIQTKNGGGHWRYTIKLKTEDHSSKEIIVPFPQLIQNQHLQDLFTKIKNVNKNIVWSGIE